MSIFNVKRKFGSQTLEEKKQDIGQEIKNSKEWLFWICAIINKGNSYFLSGMY